VVEAATQSGSWITAHLPGEQGREIFAVPSSPLDPRQGTEQAYLPRRHFVGKHRGCFGGLPALQRNAIGEDRESAYGTTPRTPTPLDETMSTQARGAITECLASTPSRIGGLVRDPNYSIDIWSLVLLEIALAGLVEQHPAGAVSLLPAV